MKLDALRELSATQIRTLVPKFLANYIGEEKASASAKSKIERLFGERSDDVLLTMIRHLVEVGEEQRLYNADPCCQDVLRTWCADVVPTHTFTGAENLLSAIEKGPTILVANHLSYFDTAALDVTLTWNGHGKIANRIFAAAGPKVYSNLFRRFASAALGTLPVPQSNSFDATNSEALTPRQLANQALQSVAQAHEAVNDGHILLLYGEGSRSRNRRLQPFVRGAHRYLKIPGAHIVPLCVTGTAKMYPVDSEQLIPTHLDVRFGAPISTDEVGNSKAALTASHAGVAAILPPEYQPSPAQ